MYSYIKPTRFKINLDQEVDIILRLLLELFLLSCDFEFGRQEKIVERLGSDFSMYLPNSHGSDCKC